MMTEYKILPPKDLSKEWKIVWFITWGRYDANIYQKHIKKLFKWNIINNFSAKDILTELYETRYLHKKSPNEKLENQYKNAFKKIEL